MSPGIRAIFKVFINQIAVTAIVFANTAIPCRSIPLDQVPEGAVECARLLKIQEPVERLLSLRRAANRSAVGSEELHLATRLTERLLAACLEVRRAADLLDRELASEYDARASMIQDRDQAIALNNRINFTQFGVLAGELADGYYGTSRQKSAPLVANILEIVAGSTTFAMSCLALLQIRGLSRPVPSKPNFLGQFLGLDVPGDKKFSPLIWTYLNSVAPGSRDGLTRRQEQIAYWKRVKVLTYNLDNPEHLRQLAACPLSRRRRSESIKLISNRISMLHDLQARVELLDGELLELMAVVD